MVHGQRPQMKFAKQSIRHFLPLDWEADVPTVPEYTAPRKHNDRIPPHTTQRRLRTELLSRQRAQWPPTTWRARPPPSLTHPFTKMLLLNNTAYNQNPMAAYPAKGTLPKENHPRRISWPSTRHCQHSKDPLVNSPLNTGS